MTDIDGLVDMDEGTVVDVNGVGRYECGDGEYGIFFQIGNRFRSWGVLYPSPDFYFVVIFYYFSLQIHRSMLLP